MVRWWVLVRGGLLHLVVVVVVDDNERLHEAFLKPIQFFPSTIVQVSFLDAMSENP
jgi:hypothetical protein